MLKLDKQDLKVVNDRYANSNKTIIKFLKEDMEIDIRQGYTKGNYSIFKGFQVVECRKMLVGIEIKNNIIINYEYRFITE